jgi:hypothetical protein
MQNCGSSLLTILQSAQRDLPDADLFEFYAPTETQLTPGNAVKRFATTETLWYGWKYDRQAISRQDVSRFVDGRFNRVTVTMSNVDRTLATWLTTTDLEGYRLVIRMISRSVSSDSVVLFVGRCDRATEVDNATVTIQAQQDLGSIENDVPWRQFSPRCPLKFKSNECLAGQALGSKSAAYQAATTCNKSWAQCTEYSNTKAFQGFRFNQVTGNFKLKKGTLLRGPQWKQWTSQDNSPMGKSVPLGLGRTQVDLIPVLSADTGQFLYGHWIVGEGPVTKILNYRNVTAGWATTFQFQATHLGEFGYNVDQESDSDFLGYAYYSRRAYTEATIKGENPDTGDPAPTLAALILWNKIPVFDESCFSDTEWSDNPVEHLRYLLTDERGLNYSTAWINNEVAAETSNYCREPLIDQTGGEDLYVSTASGTAGTDFKRYRSTGILDTAFYRWVLGLTTTYPAEQEATYNTYSDEAPPADPTPSTWYRKRYTSNWHLREPMRVTDFIFKHLLPSFRGYLITGADGRLQIRTEKPIHGGTLTANASAGATSIAVQDVYTLKQQNLPIYYALIGYGTSTSETRQITNIQYSTAGNSITLSASGGATASGSTFAGGDTEKQAQATVTIGSAVTSTITIDGTAITHTAVGTDTTGTIAAMLATRINANTTLNKYVMATWSKDLPTQVLLRSKLGTLTLASGLTTARSSGDRWYQIAMPFASSAFGALSRANILKDTFRWQLASKQSSYNQFVMQFTDAVQDFQQTEVRENDFAHQEQVNRVNKMEISGACVDNYHQADRLVRNARAKYRDGDFFCSFETTGQALLLEEGDVIAVNHDNMPNNRNALFRVEELQVTANHRVRITGRLYTDAEFELVATPKTVVLSSGVGWISATPAAVTSLTLTSPQNGVVRGTFTFGSNVSGQTAKIEIDRTGTGSSYVDTGIIVTPDANNTGTFEVAGVTSLNSVLFRVTPTSSNNQAGPATSATFTPTTSSQQTIASAFAWFIN